jgi:hypothetical protein
MRSALKFSINNIKYDFLNAYNISYCIFTGKTTVFPVGEWRSRRAISLGAGKHSRARMETGRRMYASTYMQAIGVPPKYATRIAHGSAASDEVHTEISGICHRHRLLRRKSRRNLR